jgi:large subunit ribosomal protein L21
MYAIVNIAGRQVKVEAGKSMYVAHLKQDAGTSLSFDEVLLLDNGTNVQVGKPFVSGASVTAEVVGHVKGPKVVVFKKKRRKGYAVRNGHRQEYTKIDIKSIN